MLSFTDDNLQAAQSYISAMRQGRSQSFLVRIVDLTGDLADLATPAHFLPGHAQTQGPDIELIDLYSDPWGWHQAISSTSG